MSRIKHKKGVDVIDWSMSMGVFLIAVIALFIFLKPGAQPVHDEDTLISLVEKNILSRAQWYVHETPLFVKNFQDLWGSNQQAMIEVKATGDARFTAVIPETDGRYAIIDRSPTRVKLDCDTSCDNTNFTLISATKKKQETIAFDLHCTPSTIPTACTALLGASITKQGLHAAELQQLQSENYNAVKTAWAYPQQKEFALYRDGAKIIGGEEPTQGGNIVVKELKTVTLSPTGSMTPTTISIRVW